MTCCIAFAAVIAFLRAAWLLIPGTSTRVPSFAPVARRAAPGSEDAAHIAAGRAADVEPQRHLRPGWPSIALHACGLGIAVYAVAVFATAWLDVARYGVCTCCTWKAMLRRGTELVVALAALALVTRRSHAASAERSAP